MLLRAHFSALSSRPCPPANAIPTALSLYVPQTRWPLPFLQSPYFRWQACSPEENRLFTISLTTISLSAILLTVISLSTLPSNPKLHESRDHVALVTVARVPKIQKHLNIMKSDTWKLERAQSLGS